MKETNLKKKYKRICEAYFDAFSDKHGLDPTDCFWIGDFGGVSFLGDYVADMETIRIDIDKEVPVEKWKTWYDYCQRLRALDISAPNYNSWLRGCPVKSEDELVELEALHDRIEGLKDDLKKMSER
jgi:hypothetical protein